MEMSKNFEDFRDTLISLCKDVLHGDLSLEEFFTRWPDEISQTPFVLALFDDLEDGVEHFPGLGFSGEKDFQTWESSYMAYKLQVDLQSLTSGIPEDQMLFLRRFILDQNIRDKKEIEKLICEFKEKSGGFNTY